MRQIELEGVEEVIIRFSDKETVIYNPKVIKAFIPGMMESDTYQVVGAGNDRPRESDSEVEHGVKYTDSDIDLVIAQTGATKEEVIKALEEEKGDLAGAIVRLKK